MDYLLLFIFCFLLSAVSTTIVSGLAFKFKALDIPRDRHQHKNVTPLWGGTAIFIALAIILFITKDKLLVGELNIYHWLGVLAGALTIIIGGMIDDKFNLTPVKQLIFPILASIFVIIGGVSIEKISNPFGGVLYIPAAVSAIFIILWLMGMMYTTKLLDGLDGLVSGVGAIGAFIIFLFTITTRWFQPDVAWAALAVSGVLAGFLYWNWHPAKIFLGEGGSLLIGFLLGALSIISGGKIAVALLIMGVPILDVAWTIIRRLLAGKNPLKTADRKHLHFRLLEAGLSVKQSVLVFYAAAVIFGLSALFLQSRGKLFLLLILVILIILGLFGFNWLDKRTNTR
ncbi:MAG: MraY family glycosyltransferase [Patescibacteria group bacterium]|nr:MraY family glycosyltransferase [Patescibacteria group bacterium]